MVAFHEGFHRELPVRRQHRAVAPFHAQLVEVVGFEPVDQRPDAVAHRRRVVIEVDPGGADRDFDPARDQVEIGVLQLLFGKQLLAVDEFILAMHVEAPAVERADEARLLAVPVVRRAQFTGLGHAGDRHAAVTACVVIGLDAACAGVDDDDRLADVAVFDPVAFVGDLFEAAGHLPDVRPEVVQLHLVEFRIVIALCRDALRIIHWKRNGPQARVS